MSRSARLALALLTVLPACAKDKPAPAGPGDGAGGEQACTQIGCINGLRVELKKTTPWLPGTYTFGFELDDRKVECKGSLPLQACETGPSLSCTPDAMVQIGESGCALPPAEHGFSDIQINGEPQAVKLTVTHDDKPLHTADITPNYMTSRPNGDKCEPTCRNASAEAVIP